MYKTTEKHSGKEIINGFIKAHTEREDEASVDYEISNHKKNIKEIKEKISEIEGEIRKINEKIRKCVK